MTTNAMSCELFNERLMAYLEHETDEATRALVERHAVTCVDCGAVLADVRKLRLDAVNLPELTPSRDLWAGIASRIEAPVVSIGTHREGERRPRVARHWLRGALIAASLVGAAGIGYLAAGAGRQASDGSVAVAPPETLPSVVVGRESLPTQSAPTSGAPSAQMPPGASSPSVPPSRQAEAQLVIARLTADYDREIARLRIFIDQRRNQLDPVTVAVIEKNLQVIDAAIADCTKAIARDPASRFLIESLNHSLQTKVELMRTAALLSPRT